MILNPYRFAAAVPRDGLIAEYLFDTDASDTAGEAGGPYNGTLEGNASVSAGLLSLDGTGDYVTVSDNDIFSFNDTGSSDKAFSISFWVKETTASGPVHIVDKYAGGTNIEWVCQINGADKFQLACYSTAGDYISAPTATSFTQNAWHHVVGTKDTSLSNTGMTIYLDGTEDTGTRGSDGNYSAASGMSNTTADVTLGALVLSGSPSFEVTGDMDNVRIYDRELTQTDVDDLFAEGHS